MITMSERDHTGTEASPSAGWRAVYAEMECSTDIEHPSGSADDAHDTPLRVHLDAPSIMRVVASIFGICLVVMLL
jgi:hypothetical protein